MLGNYVYEKPGLFRLVDRVGARNPDQEIRDVEDPQPTTLLKNNNCWAQPATLRQTWPRLRNSGWQYDPSPHRDLRLQMD